MNPEEVSSPTLWYTLSQISYLPWIVMSALMFGAFFMRAFLMPMNEYKHVD